jgi:hypothetical protein
VTHDGVPNADPVSPRFFDQMTLVTSTWSDAMPVTTTLELIVRDDPPAADGELTLTRSSA